MKCKIHTTGFTLWLSESDTWNWANGYGLPSLKNHRTTWPCSTLSHKRLVAVFDTNGLCDLAINGGRGDQDCDGSELSAIVADFMRARLPADHPCRFVAVDQFS